MSFKIKISILFSIIFVFFFFLIYDYLTKRGESYIIEELNKRGNSLATSLAMVAKEPLIDEDLAELSRLTYSIKKEENLVFVYIVDKYNKIRGSPDYEEVGKNVEDILRIYKAKQNFFLFEKDVSMGGINIGKVYLALSLEILEKAKKDFRKVASIIFFLFLFLGLISIFLFSYISLKPLNYIIKALKRIGEGDLEKEIRYPSKDEFGKIVEVAEEMRIKLIEYRKDLMEKERLRRDAELAKEIQKMLLPEKLPDLREYEISYYYEPAFYVGGDYVDVLKTITHTFCIIGDVSGKGASSSLIMALTKSFIYSNYKTSRSPIAFAANIHSFLRDKIPDDMFLTLFLLYLEDNGNYTYSSCGHTPPLLYTSNTNLLRKFKTNGVPIGFSFVSSEEYPSFVQKGQGKLEKDDVLFLYTDGLIDVRNEKGETLGEDGIFNLFYEIVREVKSVEKIKNKMVDKIKEFMGKSEPEDDITFLIIKKK
ncbi:MAG: SpoIIE family protein phosphatase [Candidatus Hydrothermales bacterium]